MKKVLVGFGILLTFHAHSASVMDLVDMTIDEMQCESDSSCMPGQQRAEVVIDKERDCTLYIENNLYHTDANPVGAILVDDLDLNNKYDVVDDSSKAKYKMNVAIQGNMNDLSKVKASIVVRDSDNDIFEVATGKSGYFKRSILSSLENANNDLNGCK